MLHLGASQSYTDVWMERTKFLESERYVNFSFDSKSTIKKNSVVTAFEKVYCYFLIDNLYSYNLFLNKIILISKKNVFFLEHFPDWDIFFEKYF